MCLMALTMRSQKCAVLEFRGLQSVQPAKPASQEYVDVGLPSGTKWRGTNAAGFYTYDEAVSQFGKRLPSKEQWQELRAECQWSWNGNGYNVTGPNANSISLPAAGCRNCGGSVGSVGSCGYYWSSASKEADNAWDLRFGSSSVGIVRLLPVQRSIRPAGPRLTVAHARAQGKEG